MIFRRIKTHIEKENWFAVGIDFCIVVIGVFIGIQVANWNEVRAVRTETDRTLELLVPANKFFEENAEDFKAYYATTKAYGETALRAWEDPEAISDVDFLVAAYQASQIMAGTSEIEVFAEMIGADNIRNIKDVGLQRRLQNYIINPSNLSRTNDIDTPYRQNVRRAIPFDIQEKIRTECGDRRDDILRAVRLPADCNIDLPTERARIAAENLRARTDLRDDLQWHMASIQSVLADLDNEIARNKALMSTIESYLQ